MRYQYNRLYFLWHRHLITCLCWFTLPGVYCWGYKRCPIYRKVAFAIFRFYESGRRPGVASHRRAQHGLFDSYGLILGLFLLGYARVVSIKYSQICQFILKYFWSILWYFSEGWNVVCMLATCINRFPTYAHYGLKDWLSLVLSPVARDTWLKTRVFYVSSIYEYSMV